MTKLAERATRAGAVLAHLLVSVLIVFSTACVLRPNPGSSTAAHVAALVGFLALLVLFVGGEMRVTRVLGFQEPDWIMIPRFAAMALAVLLSGRVEDTTDLRAVTFTVVGFAFLRALFHSLAVMNHRIDDHDEEPATGSGDAGPDVVVEVSPITMGVLRALDPVVDLYFDGLCVLYGEPGVDR